MYCSKCGAVVSEGATYCSSCGQSLGGAGASAAVATAPVAKSVGYAGFWLRFVAWLIDRIALQIAGGLIFFPLLGASGLFAILRSHPPQSPEDLFPLFRIIYKLALLGLILNWLYYALTESSSWQATLGKRTLGLYVADMDGRRIGFGRATARFFGRIVSGLTLAIGFIMAGFTARKQALHDMMAGCLVLRKL